MSIQIKRYVCLTEGKKHVPIIPLEKNKQNSNCNMQAQTKHVNYFLEIKKNNKKLEQPWLHKKEKKKKETISPLNKNACTLICKINKDEFQVNGNKKVKGANPLHAYNNTLHMMIKKQERSSTCKFTHIHEVDNNKMSFRQVLKCKEISDNQRGVDSKANIRKIKCLKSVPIWKTNETIKKDHFNEEPKSGINTKQKHSSNMERKIVQTHIHKTATNGGGEEKCQHGNKYLRQEIRGIFSHRPSAVFKNKMKENSAKGNQNFHFKEEMKEKNELYNKCHNGNGVKGILFRSDGRQKNKDSSKRIECKNEEINTTTCRYVKKSEEYQKLFNLKLNNGNTYTHKKISHECRLKKGAEKNRFIRKIENVTCIESELGDVKINRERFESINGLRKCKVNTILLSKSWMKKRIIEKLASFNWGGKKRGTLHSDVTGRFSPNDENCNEMLPNKKQIYEKQLYEDTETGQSAMKMDTGERGVEMGPLKRYKIIALKQKNKGLRNNYIIIKKIGKGTFGKVCLGIHIHTQEMVAIKILNKKRLKRLISYDKIMKEIEIHQQMNHNHICQFYEVYENRKNIYMILEYVSNGDLLTYIYKNKKRINEDTTRRIFYQLISAVDYLHKLNVVHRDLKPENILLDDNENIKLIDFGLSTVYKKNNLLTTSCGSPFYTSPEILLGNKYHGELTDVWSLGVILFLLLNRKLPFNHSKLNILFQKIIKGLLHFEPYISESAKNLIRNMLNVNYQKRYSLRDIKRHPWFFTCNMKKGNLTNLYHDSCNLICCNLCLHKISIQNNPHLMRLILNKICKIYTIDVKKVFSDIRKKEKNFVQTAFYLLLNKTIRMLSRHNYFYSHILLISQQYPHQTHEKSELLRNSSGFSMYSTSPALTPSTYNSKNDNNNNNNNNNNSSNVSKYPTIFRNISSFNFLEILQK
ncbi:serine/threonine protein kinase [Plasmodium gonderi]|uniref:Serine/threonine protein kinase n=1 Tax=Plasmodium gonderi TaxID=77519 RepID=A0A1Y1JR94_PLAGO|nr:serine/threonine protein kinase [Plasmodium gonderi]GAW82544.1 serine/threonine protein kinase [Plasmodium gonderi]